MSTEHKSKFYAWLERHALLFLILDVALTAFLLAVWTNYDRWITGLRAIFWNQP